MSEIVVAVRPGLPARRVRVVRIDARRRGQIARRMAAAGHPRWFIRKIARLSVAGLDRALAAKATASIWGAFATQIREEMRAA